MAQLPTTVIQQPFSWSTSYDLTVTDDQGIGRTVTLGTLSTTTWWRTFLASAASPSTPSTDQAAPKRLLDHIAARLNAGGPDIWVLNVNTDGLVVFNYSGVVRAGTIVFPSDDVRAPLGHVANVACAMGGTSTAPYLPAHSVQFLNLTATDGWTRTPGFVAAARRPGGTVYGWSDRRTGRRKVFATQFIPFDWTKRTTLGAAASPMWPNDTTRYTQPSSAAGVSLPWSVHDFLSTCLGQRCGALLGTFQRVLTGSVTTYDVISVDPDTLQRSDVQKIEVADWDAYAKAQNIIINWIATESL